MSNSRRPEPAILRTRLVRGADGRLTTEPRSDEPKTTEKSKLAAWPFMPFVPHIKRPKINSPKVDITIRFPKLHRPHISKADLARLVHQLPKWSRRTYASVGLVAVVLIAGGTLLHNHFSGQSSGSVQGASTASGPTPGTPSYATILPHGKSIKSLGGWYRVSPPSSDPVYAFADQIGSVPLDVSEQPLPDSFKNDTSEQVAQLAQSFGAGEKLTAQGLTFYIGTSAKGPQSIILTKNNLLILIRSTAILTNDQWIAYISSLQ